MSFKKEIWLIETIILVLIPFNPTNIFVDMLTVTLIDSLFNSSRMFFWIGLALPLAMKCILAIAEVEFINDIYERLRKKKK
jgi:hypothetical protein